jgi:hypothetical protein
VRTAICIAAALAVAPACQRDRTTKAEENPAGQSVTIVFAGSIAGMNVPCGCSPDQLGGLPRAAALVKKLRGTDPHLLFVDAGDLLFEATPRGQLRDQHELKARTLARGEALMGAQARAVGSRDLALGPQFAAQAAEGVPLLDAGGVPVAGARPGIVLDAGGTKVGFFAAGLGDASSAALKARAQQLRSEGARFVVLLFHPKPGEGPSWPRAQAIAPAAKAAGVDAVVLGHRDDLATDPNLVDVSDVPVLAAQGHFQYLLKLALRIPQGAAADAPVFLSRGEAGKKEVLQRFDDRIARLREQAEGAPPERRKLYLDKVAEQEKMRAEAAAKVEQAPAGSVVATVTFLPLDKDAGEDAEAKALVDRYDEQVSAMNLKLAQLQPESCPAPAPGEPYYIGISEPPKGADASCASCHATQAEFWTKSGHSHAWNTLVKIKKDLNLDCVQCHVTGWQQPGGVCRIDRTHVGGPGIKKDGHKFGVGRQDVQCESCHGPASEHAKDPPGNIKVQVTKSDCMRCHEAANSPHFNYEKYLPGVIGPGHGAPLAAGQKPGPVWPKPASPASEGKQ